RATHRFRPGRFNAILRWPFLALKAQLSRLTGRRVRGSNLDESAQTTGLVRFSSAKLWYHGPFLRQSGGRLSQTDVSSLKGRTLASATNKTALPERFSPAVVHEPARRGKTAGHFDRYSQLMQVAAAMFQSAELQHLAPRIHATGALAEGSNGQRL